LQQPPEVRVMPGPGARSAAEFARGRLGEHKALDDATQAGVMDLAAQMLEEALELLDRAIRGGQELGGIERPGLQAAHVVELSGQLTLEALDPAPGQHSVAAVEA